MNRDQELKLLDTLASMADVIERQIKTTDEVIAILKILDKRLDRLEKAQ